MDTRLLVIAAPVLVAASWALFNIGRLALQQIQRLTSWLILRNFQTKVENYQSYLTFSKNLM
jgi:hypothetical protein